MPLFTSLMRLHYSSSTFYERVFKSASISFWHELFIIYGWWWLGFGFHKQVYYIHLVLTALVCLRVIFPAFVLVVIILLGAKTFRVCNSTQFLGNVDLMERHVVFIFLMWSIVRVVYVFVCLFLLQSLLNSSVATVTLVLFCSNDLWQLVCTGTLLFRSWQVSCSH